MVCMNSERPKNSCHLVVTLELGLCEFIDVLIYALDISYLFVFFGDETIVYL